MAQFTFDKTQQEMHSEAISEMDVSAAHERKHKKPVWLIAGAAVLCLLLGLMIAPRASAQAKTRRYTRGTAYLEAGNYEKALKVFSALGDYEDAPTAAAYAEKGIAYTQAKEAMELGDYEKAGSSFDALDDFEDARKLAAECRQALAYEAGKAFYAEANYDAAIEALEAAKGYGDSKTLLDRCRLTVTQRDIENAMRVGDYASALSLLETEIGAKVENGNAMADRCRTEIKYSEADTAFKDGLYYTASGLFKDLGSFRDAQTRAEECILSKPSTGELYHNPDYKASDCSLTIKPNTSNGTCTYFKIYRISGSEETLVSCVFIRTGSTATVKLPAGTYILKTANSSGNWYGEQEMFGPGGVYQRLKSSGSSDRFELERYGDYVLTMNTSVNGNVGSQKEQMATF